MQLAEARPAAPWSGPGAAWCPPCSPGECRPGRPDGAGGSAAALSREEPREPLSRRPGHVPERDSGAGRPGAGESGRPRGASGTRPPRGLTSSPCPQPVPRGAQGSGPEWLPSPRRPGVRAAGNPRQAVPAERAVLIRGGCAGLPGRPRRARAGRTGKSSRRCRPIGSPHQVAGGKRARGQHPWVAEGRAGAEHILVDQRAAGSRGRFLSPPARGMARLPSCTAQCAWGSGPWGTASGTAVLRLLRRLKPPIHS